MAKDLCQFSSDSLAQKSACPHIHPLPSSETVANIVDVLRSVFFPFHFGNTDFSKERQVVDMSGKLERLKPIIKEQVLRGLCYECRLKEIKESSICEKQAEKITTAFLLKLPQVKNLLESDVKAAYTGDPAAMYKDEAVFCYPCIRALINYRCAHELYLLKVPLIPRIMTEQAHSETGIDINPGAKIGENFFIDHGTGVVIGETSIIGKNVRLYQGVTLGAKSFPLDKDGNPVKGVARHPIVEDNVIIYSESTILGRVTIGHDSVIGGNVWLTQSISPFSRVTQAAAQETKFESGGGI